MEIEVTPPPVPAQLLEPCELPDAIDTSSLNSALRTLVANHAKYAECYSKQESLRRSVIERQQ